MPLRHLSLAVFLSGSFWSPPADAQQGMAFTTPRDPAIVVERPIVPPVQRPAPSAQGALVPTPGRLPNQATGPRKERVVRDICIGC